MKTIHSNGKHALGNVYKIGNNDTGPEAEKGSHLVQNEQEQPIRCIVPSLAICCVRTSHLHNSPHLQHQLTSPETIDHRPRSDAMSMSTPTPLVGRLVPLRTKDEVRASLETHDVYVIEVPAKFANVIKE